MDTILIGQVMQSYPRVHIEILAVSLSYCSWLFQVIYYDVIHKGRLKKNSNPDDEEDSEFNKRDNRKHSTSGSELADYSATADYDEEPLLTVSDVL